MSRADGSDAATRGPTRRTLPLARRALVAAIARDTPGTDQPRLVKVLDALIAWSVARPTLLAFRDDERRGDVLAFVCAGTTVVCWSAQVTRGVGPRLEIYPPTGRSLSAEQRAMVIRTVNAHARQALIDPGPGIIPLFEEGNPEASWLDLAAMLAPVPRTRTHLPLLVAGVRA